MNYYNSAIEIKRRTCKSCGNNAIIFSKNRCAYCAKKEDAKPIKKATSHIEDKELENFFRHAALEIAKNPYCSNCKEFIPEQYYRHATAHILSKKLFKSVASHPLNYLVLGAGCGCHSKSEVWSNFEKMKVFPLAVERFKILYDFLYPYEHQFIAPELLKHIK